MRVDPTTPIRFWLSIWLGVTLAGCEGSSGSATVTCTNPIQTKICLLSEVTDDFESLPESSYQFPFHNGTGHPVQLRVRSIGCTCYQVVRGAQRLKVGEQFELGAGATETLVLKPARPVKDQVADFNFSLEYEPAPGQPKQTIACQGVLNSVADIRLDPTLLSAEFVQDSPAQRIVMEVKRTARTREAALRSPVTSGWPPGTQVGEPEAMETAAEDGDHLWSQSWRVTAMIPKPEKAVGAEQYWSINVSDATPGTTPVLARLKVQFRSGLSGPRVVHFQEVVAGQPVTRRIQIFARDDLPFRILGPVEPAAELLIESDSSEALATHWANLSLTPTVAGHFRQVLKIETDHPQQTHFEVEVQANVTAAASP